VLHYLPHALVLAAVLVAFYLGNRRRPEDASWEARWNELPAEDRIRLAAAARSGALLAEPEEMSLAAGFARRERRRRAPGALLASLDLPIAAILILGGLVTGIALFLIAGIFFLLLALWRLIRHRRVSRGLRETISRDHSV
jgi:Flp pilus assembly protein TadB